MTEKHACIYCGNTETSESDIIPDALTNARITNKNVCKTEHNNKFSDLFESDVIEALALITNGLDIKSHKGENYAAYSAKIEIDGIEYSTKMTSEKDLFNGRKVLVSTDGKHKLSSMDKITKIAQDPSQISEVDINNLPLCKKVEIDINVYFSEKMFRMIAKIAYEWYCSRNDVVGYHDEFENIVKFITSGEGNNPVTILQNEELYKYCGKQVSLGSHCLFAYIDNEEKINVIVSLFGIAMYRVVVSDDIPAFCENNFMFMELRTDSSRKELKHVSREEAENYFFELLKPSNFIEGANIAGMHIMIPKVISSIDVVVYPFVFNMTKCFLEINDETREPNERIVRILKNNIQEVLQASSLHKKSIQRFVKEYFSDGHEPIILNPNSSNKKTVLLFYILFVIGRDNIEHIDDKSLQDIAKKALDMGVQSELIVTDEIEKKLQSEMLATKGYSDLLEKGAEVIKRWND